MPHIELSGVSLVYDTPSGQVPGVDGVSFSIEASEFLCIVGPSGCGKSTLLSIIAGFLPPTSGEVRIAGKPVTGHGLDRGVVFQDFAQLFPWRTALGNVTFGLEMKGVGRAEREELALKEKQGLTVSLVLPTLNEEETVGPIVRRQRRRSAHSVPITQVGTITQVGRPTAAAEELLPLGGRWAATNADELNQWGSTVDMAVS